MQVKTQMLAKVSNLMWKKANYCNIGHVREYHHFGTPMHTLSSKGSRIGDLDFKVLANSSSKIHWGNGDCIL